MSSVEKRIKELGWELPAVPKPGGAYVPALRTGNLVFISGQGVTRDGKVFVTGHVGSEVTPEQGYECARVCALNTLSALKSAIGDLDKVKQIVKVLGFISSAPGFDQQPYVLNGFSDAMEKIFGEKGKHTRTTVSTNELPFGTPVVVEMIVEVED